MTPAYAQILARHNRWANETLHAACVALPSVEVERDRGAFFGSILGTLNHLLVAERIWFARLDGQPAPYDRLDTPVVADLADWWDQRQAQDSALIRRADALTEADLAETLTYTRQGQAGWSTPMAMVWAHMFNHATHHRAQAHTLISQAGGAAPPLDIPIWLRQVGAPLTDA